MNGKDGFLRPYQYEYQLAKMANAVYKDENTIRKSMEHADPATRLLPDDWRILDEFEDTNAKTGFVAGAFINDKTKQIVIAYRGSEPKGPEAHGLIDYKGANVAIAQDGDMRGVTDNLALRAGGQFLARQHAPDWHAQFEQGLHYAERILKQSRTMPGGPYTVHVTGHSLGGAIAQVTHESSTCRAAPSTRVARRTWCGRMSSRRGGASTTAAGTTACGARATASPDAEAEPG